MTKGEAKCEPLPENLSPQPTNDPNKPSTNVNGTTTTLLPQPFKQSESSSMGFNLNCLLFVFIGIVFFT
uniref:Uncharacterized protein n=1 Tax=Panagrolaimus davidi TaxID=227884 RepID=A0A914QA66_9BILA